MFIQIIPNFRNFTNLTLELAEAKAEKIIAQKHLDNAETIAQELRNRLREARKQCEDCLEGNSNNHSICAEKLNTLEINKIEFNNFQKHELRKRQNILEDTIEKYEIISARYNAKLTQYHEMIAPMFDLLERLTALNIQILDLYKEYIKLEGGTGQINWTLPWDEVLENYRTSNPNLRVNWQRLPIKEAEFLATVNSSDTNTELSSIPAVKFASIPGIRPVGFYGMGTGNKIEEVKNGPTAVPEFLQSGAANAASGLMKCYHLYCQASSLILGVADSIWGKSNAVANFHSNNSSWVTEKVSGIQFVTRSGTLSFR